MGLIHRDDGATESWTAEGSADKMRADFADFEPRSAFAPAQWCVALTDGARQSAKAARDGDVPAPVEAHGPRAARVVSRVS